ncbi:MAG: hypothetical protein HY474_01605 [Candidatus Sungbacteria bacterium]|uniref:Uncharacterized protein n=1 Tax=Candidatus Sungiibacteriota bacterium TaxID=2750080 RepID=A0A932YXY0_9BACT|nr:hypothetical protein [Candidatus Sungbacteria bacterium]
MTEAWRHRSFTQQEFIRGLAHEAHEWAEGAGDADADYERAIIQLLIALLDVAGRMSLAEEPLELPLLNPSLPVVGFVNRIVEFARVPSEQLYLVHQLFAELVKSFASWAQRDYLRDQIERPMEVFGASSAMTEIEE